MLRLGFATDLEFEIIEQLVTLCVGNLSRLNEILLFTSHNYLANTCGRLTIIIRCGKAQYIIQPPKCATQEKLHSYSSDWFKKIFLQNTFTTKLYLQT